MVTDIVIVMNFIAQAREIQKNIGDVGGQMTTPSHILSDVVGVQISYALSLLFYLLSSFHTNCAFVLNDPPTWKVITRAGWAGWLTNISRWSVDPHTSHGI